MSTRFFFSYDLRHSPLARKIGNFANKKIATFRPNKYKNNIEQKHVLDTRYRYKTKTANKDKKGNGNRATNNTMNETLSLCSLPLLSQGKRGASPCASAPATLTQESWLVVYIYDLRLIIILRVRVRDQYQSGRVQKQRAERKSCFLFQ